MTTWLTASKKKNFDTMKVLTSITKLATIIVSRQMMLSTRIVFKMTYPGPARDFLKKAIVKVMIRIWWLEGHSMF